MFDKLRHIPAAAILILGVVSLGFAAPAAATESVALTFAWPEGLAGHVTYKVRTTKTVNGQSKRFDVFGQYGFRASTSWRNILIEFENTRSRVDLTVSDPAQLATRFLAKAISVPPNYVVGGDGSLRRLKGLKRYRKNMLDGVEDVLAEFSPDMRDHLMQVVRSMMTEDQLEASVGGQWDLIVGTWAGEEFELGTLYESHEIAPIAVYGNASVPIRTTYRYIGRVPCNGADAATRCVELELQSTIAPDGTEDASESVLAKNPVRHVGIRVEDSRKETTVRLITEPDTLIPHLFEMTERIENTVSDGDRRLSGERVKESRYVYTY